MKNLSQFLRQARSWWETDVLAGLLSEPSPRSPYDPHVAAPAVQIAIDVSLSMDFTDYRPSRLAGAQQAAHRYLDTKRQTAPQTRSGRASCRERV